MTNNCKKQPTYSTDIDPSFIELIKTYIVNALKSNYPIHRHPIYCWTEVNKDLKAYVEINLTPIVEKIRRCQHDECTPPALMKIKDSPCTAPQQADSTNLSADDDAHAKFGVDQKMNTSDDYEKKLKENEALNVELQKKLIEHEALKAVTSSLDNFLNNSANGTIDTLYNGIEDDNNNEDGALEVFYNGNQDEDDSAALEKKDGRIVKDTFANESLKRKLDLKDDDENGDTIPKLTLLNAAIETGDEGDDEDDCEESENMSQWVSFRDSVKSLAIE